MIMIPVKTLPEELSELSLDV